MSSPPAPANPRLPQPTSLPTPGHFQIPSTLWEPAQELLSVRNVLVHDNGAMDSLHPEQRSALAKIRGIRIIADEIEVGAECVQAAFDAVKAIAAFLDQGVRGVIDRAIRPRPVA